MSTLQYPSAVDEKYRIAKLHEYKLLNNDHEPAFARLTDLVKLFFGFPIVTITFMDEDTQYLRAVHGLARVPAGLGARFLRIPHLLHEDRGI